MRTTRERRRALVIDDDEEHRALMCDMLGRMGIDAEPVGSGVEALKVLLGDELRYHLVVTDVTMPRLSGIDVMGLLRRTGSIIPFVVVSGVAHEEIESDVAAIGRAVHLRKPVPPRTFERVVRSFMWPT